VLEHASAALDAAGLSAERLELELPEAALLDASVEVLLTLAALQDLGVGVVLDNFGTGHASIGVPMRVPLTAMKLDRSLVRALPDAAEGTEIVRSLVDFGHALGLKVIAAGVESAAQHSLLARIGCEEAQGNLFSHALEADQLRDRLLWG
jgi:EAL domain-containing protein (putative c-di-GMP-specific phosphodiesterase class I)